MRDREKGEAVVEEIKALKELLDIGAITQEEFEAKKRELLGMPAQPLSTQPQQAVMSQPATTSQPQPQPTFASQGQHGYPQPAANLVHPGISSYEQATYAPPAAYEKNKMAAGLLAIFLGSLGVHKFYLGYTTQGIIMLLCSLLGALFIVGPFVIGIIALIEGIIYLTKTDADFDAIYVKGSKGWF